VPIRIAARDSARLFLAAQGFYADRQRRATRATVERLVQDLGFVQLDSINVVARAHDLTLWSRLDGYRPAVLTALLQDEPSLFEHWTHDASAIPLKWYTHWKPRFRRDGPRLCASPWWQKLIGDNSASVLTHVLERIEKEGPLGSADFEHEGPREPWWGWKPAKAALDYLWRTGELAVAGRVHFHKLYDLPARVYPKAHRKKEPDDDTHREWACSEAAERLWLFTAKELAEFFHAVDASDARAYCQKAEKTGRLVAVELESSDGSPPQPAYALSDFAKRLQALDGPPSELRLLCPFDPVLRDRARCRRRFGFDYKFEAFTPPPQRRYGYYTLPILDGETLIGRLDPKLHRDRRELEVKSLHLEPGIKLTRERKRRLREALLALASFVGAAALTGPGT
jgi:uncharacterized protein YcaQ